MTFASIIAGPRLTASIPGCRENGVGMRVLHVISGLAEGGPEHQLRLLVRRLPHESEVVTLSRPGAVAEALRAGGTTVHQLDDRRELGNQPSFATVVGLRRLIRRGHFDLVHTHVHRACVPGRFAARLAGVPRVVATEHDLTGEAGRFYRAGERLGRVTIAATSSVADRLRGWGVPDARIAVIPKAVAADEFTFDPAIRDAVRARLGIPAGAAVVGGVGRLEPGERFDRLIRAVGEVPGATLLLVGDGPARDALGRLAAIEGIADRVVFAGAVAHAREMLCAMDVFASPCERTYGLVVLEALAAGLPALYARCEPLDTPAAPVDGVKRLTPHDRESLPRALRVELLCCQERGFRRLPARTAGTRYDADHLADEVDRVYRRTDQAAARR